MIKIEEIVISHINIKAMIMDHITKGLRPMTFKILIYSSSIIFRSFDLLMYLVSGRNIFMISMQIIILCWEPICDFGYIYFMDKVNYLCYLLYPYYFVHVKFILAS